MDFKGILLTALLMVVPINFAAAQTAVQQQRVTQDKKHQQHQAFHISSQANTGKTLGDHCFYAVSKGRDVPELFPV